MVIGADKPVTMFRVLIVEDDPIIQQRIERAMLAGGRCTVQSVGNLADARAALRMRVPDLILSDLCLPDGRAIEFLADARKLAPKTEIVVISVLGDEETILAAIASGATGYILKDSFPADVHSLAMDVLAGGSPMSPSIARLVVMQARVHQQSQQVRPLDLLAPLTPREMDVLWGIAKGFSYSEVATQLGISGNTVPSHVKAIYRKLRVDNRSSAIYEAVQQGIIKF
jgi:DNA-binding NarL/FixJ family response regulator